MCCGNDYDGLEAAMAAPSGEGGMTARVYAVTDGANLRIGNYGSASRLLVTDQKTGKAEWVDTPAIVPDEVAAQFEAEVAGEVEVEVPDPKDPTKRKRQMQKFAAGPRKDIRVERDQTAKKAPASAREK